MKLLMTCNTNRNEYNFVCDEHDLLNETRINQQLKDFLHTIYILHAEGIGYTLDLMFNGKYLDVKDLHAPCNHNLVIEEDHIIGFSRMTAANLFESCTYLV